MIYRYEHTDERMGEVDYENPWHYKGTAFTSNDIGDFFGYVYRITNIKSGKQYIGRKYFYQKRKPKGGKRRVTSESDWKRYYGSSDELKRDIKEIGKDFFRRENQKEENGELLLSQIGRSIMDPVQNSRRTLNYLENPHSQERF